MKPRILATAVLAFLGSSCSTVVTQQPLALRIEPIQSIRHGVTSAQSYYQLGRYYQGQNRLDMAEDAYLKATALDNRNIDAFNALGSLYAQRGETERALKMFERLTAVISDAAYLHNNLGYVYFLAGHQDKAYDSVRKALVLDANLERAWVNLEKIVTKAGDDSLAEVARLHRVDALPLAMGLSTNPGAPDAGSGPAVAVRAPDSKLTLTTGLSNSPLVEEVLLAEANTVPHTMETAISHLATVASPPVRDILSGIATKTGQKREGDFVLVSSHRKLVSNGQPLDVSPALATGRHAAEDRAAKMAAFRLEVSNGNGIRHFANNFSSLLRQNDIPVMRITNHCSFSMRQTVVEYQPGFENAASALLERAELNARLVPAIRSREGVDIRIVLGKDAVNFNKLDYAAKRPRPAAAGVS